MSGSSENLTYTRGIDVLPQPTTIQEIIAPVVAVHGLRQTISNARNIIEDSEQAIARLPNGVRLPDGHAFSIRSILVDSAMFGQYSDDDVADRVPYKTSQDEFTEGPDFDKFLAERLMVHEGELLALADTGAFRVVQPQEIGFIRIEAKEPAA